MAVIIIGCPSCRRRLNLPAGLRGQSVQCPGCGLTFPASHELETRRSPSEQAPAPLPPAPTHSLEKEQTPDTSDERLTEEGEVQCPLCGEFIDRDSRRCRHCRALLNSALGGPTPFWVRRDCEPHRGSWIQLLGTGSFIMGLLSFFLCGISGLVAVPAGVCALVMANRDLAKMEEGIMDPAGRTQTNTGRQLAMLGVIFGALCGVGYGFIFALQALAGL